MATRYFTVIVSKTHKNVVLYRAITFSRLQQEIWCRCYGCDFFYYYCIKTPQTFGHIPCHIFCSPCLTKLVPTLWKLIFFTLLYKRPSKLWSFTVESSFLCFGNKIVVVAMATRYFTDIV